MRTQRTRCTPCADRSLIRKDRSSDYGVDFPDSRGCISAGTTIEEAVTLGREALADHIAVMREYGEEVRAPTGADTILSDLSNRDDFVALFLVPIPSPPPRRFA